jgi:hypothetical protein
MSEESPERTPHAVGKGEARRASHHERLLAMVTRSPLRSPLFWWLFEHHDELLAGTAASRVGMPWSRLCGGFAEVGLTSVDGGVVGPETARKTWQRVRKEKARLRRLEAEAEADRALRRAQDPRRNMPSRMSGRYEAPLAEVQPRRGVVEPPRPQSLPVADAPAVVPEERADTPVGSPMIVTFQEEPLDLNLFVRPGVQEPWNKPGIDPEGRQRLKLTMLTLRFENWKKDRVLDPNNRVDRERKRLNALRNAK